VKLAPAL
jgi:hypothetical protein